MLRRKKDAENYNNSHLFLDLVSDEITLYESSIIPNPNAFVTLGTSYKYIPLSFSQWKEQQERE
jgi:hypothetical protein